jgi:hypothetical protein
MDISGLKEVLSSLRGPLIVMAVLTLAVTGRGQATTRSLSGLVLDASGRAIPHANITINSDRRQAFAAQLPGFGRIYSAKAPRQIQLVLRFEL